MAAAGLPWSAQSPMFKKRTDLVRTETIEVRTVVRPGKTKRLNCSALQEDIDEARLMNDHGRIAKLESDQEAFEIEIAKATGLGGKKLESTDADRVRRNGSMAVTRAIDSILDEHQVLGRHLRNSISSGLSFCYDP